MRKALVLVASLALIVSIFVPWITSWLFQISPYEYFKSFINDYEIISRQGVDWRLYLPFLLVLLPLCSLWNIIEEFRVGGSSKNILISISIITLVMALVIAALIYAAVKAEAKNPFEGMGYGFWVAIGGNVVLLISLLLEKKDKQEMVPEEVAEPEELAQETVATEEPKSED